MKKAEQKAVNTKVEELVNVINDAHFSVFDAKSKQLRSCTARVYEVGNYAILKSYNTVIAVIDKSTDTLYDFLRMVYGYTNTSAQHISKFNHDYCNGTWGCENVLTWRDI